MQNLANDQLTPKFFVAAKAAKFDQKGSNFFLRQQFSKSNSKKGRKIFFASGEGGGEPPLCGACAANEALTTVSRSSQVLHDGRSTLRCATPP